MARRRRSAFSYGEAPRIRVPRSRFDLSHSHKTTANVGQLFPCYLQEVVAGDSFKITAGALTRVTSSFIRPIMDSLFMDIRFFYVPSRILYDRWEEIFGYNPDGPWFNDEDVSVPSVYVCLPGDVSDTVKYKDTLADYFGDVSPGMNYSSSRPYVSQLPYRAFGKIWNDWYVSEATGTPVVYKSSALDTSAQSCNSDVWSPSNIFGKCPNVYKCHDRFTSALPSPQKGEPINLPLQGNAPVISSAAITPPTTEPIQWRPAPESALWPTGKNIFLGINAMPNPEKNAPGFYFSSDRSADFLAEDTYQPANLWADMSNVSAATVNELRVLFQTQKLLERAAAYGTRYTEVLASLYGVDAGDYRLQRSEYLGGARLPLQIQQVASTNRGNSTDDPADTQLGELGAYSLSFGKCRVNKGFVEPGWILGLACIRQYHTYQQGIDPTHRRFSRMDQYNPLFVNIGMQPVYTTELYGSAPVSQIFGYQFNYDEMRSVSNRISGGLRSTLPNSMDIWHLGDYYANAPTLNDDFLKETPDNVDRVITVPSSTEDQFIIDFGFDVSAIRPLPTYGSPGLIDHH